MVRALNIERWCTLKGMNEDFDPESFMDYYVNKVREQDVEKIIEFAPATICQ